MFLFPDVETIFNTDVFDRTIYQHSRLYMPHSNGLLVITIKPEPVCILWGRHFALHYVENK
jgi:hypothetical protein